MADIFSNPELFYGRLPELAGQYDPFPLLKQLDNTSQAVAQRTMMPTENFGWANPNATAMPQLPLNQQSPGVQLAGQGQGQQPGATPMSLEQIRALQVIQAQNAAPRAQVPHAPGGGLGGRPGQVSFQHLQTQPAAPIAKMSLAQILGR